MILTEQQTAPATDVRDFGDWAAEYRALTESVGLVRDADFGYVQLSGPDRAGFLNRLATNQLDRLPAGAGRESFLADAKGHVLAFVRVFAGPDSLVLATSRDQAPRVIAHLDHYLVREKVELGDRSREWAGLLLAGPRAFELLGKTAEELVEGDRPLFAAWKLGPSPGSSPAGPEPLEHAGMTIDGRPAHAHCLRPDRPAALLITCRIEDLPPIRQALLSAGARACGQQAAEAFRIECGWPRDRQDITDKNLPQEVARDASALSFTKGCYLGQETVARIESRGHVNQFLAGLVFASADPPPAGAELISQGSPVGRVTSSAFSPRLQSAVGLGYVRRGHHEPGTPLDSPSGPVRVVALPMW